MARIDGLLRLVIQQGADELRLVVEREPKMYARGAPKRLSVPATSEETLRILLGDILSPEREEELKARGRAETVYEAQGIGAFKVKFKLGGAGGFEVAFLSGEVHGLELAAAAPVPPAPPTPPTPETPEAGEAPAAASRKTTIGHASTVPQPPQPQPQISPPLHPVQTLAKSTLLSAGANAESAPPARQPKPSATLPDAAAKAESRPQPAAAGAVHYEPEHSAPAYEPALPEAHGTRVSHGSSELNELLRRAANLGASDLHLAEGEIPRVRVDGKLTELTQSPVGELLPLLDLDELSSKHLLRTGAADLALELHKIGRMRVHVYRTDAGYAAALRLLPRAAPSFSELNMPLPFDDLVEQPHGLVLVCGAAGAGKSTTLAALAQELLRRRSVLMVTLEDPIEYTLTPTAHSIVRRRQVGRDVRDFPAGLRDALRADPEVLLVGEMRDPTSITLALTAAETGHLVLSSLHSGSATSAIERIVDAYPIAHKEQIRTQLSDALRAIIVQRLLPRAHNGGRIPAVEVLRVTRAVASLIREGKTAQLPTVLQSSRREGMISLERSLADRVQAGEVSLHDASAAANDPDTLLTYLSAGKSRAV